MSQKRFNNNYNAYFAFLLEQGSRDESTICFVHAVSPIKKASNTGTEYFNCTLQMENSARRAVCFSPGKRKLLAEVDKARSPVKITKHDISKGDVVINNRTNISLMDNTAVTFQHDPLLAKDAFVTIKELEKLAPWQLLNIKASVATVNGMTTHQGKDGQSLNKQEVIIRDSTGCCSFYLYGEDSGKLEVGKSYILKNLRLRVVKGSVFLNTSKAEPFLYQMMDNLKDLVEVPSINLLTEQTMIGKVSGVSTIKQSFGCMVCGKTGTVEDKDIFSCSNCNIKSNVKSVVMRWGLSLLISDVATNEKYVMYFNNDNTHALADALSFDLSSQEEVASSLLREYLDPVKLLFDITTKEVKQLSKI